MPEERLLAMGLWPNRDAGKRTPCDRSHRLIHSGWEKCAFRFGTIFGANPKIENLPLRKMQSGFRFQRGLYIFAESMPSSLVEVSPVTDDGATQRRYRKRV